jgi:hypothetical protein
LFFDPINATAIRIATPTGTKTADTFGNMKGPAIAGIAKTTFRKNKRDGIMFTAGTDIYFQKLASYNQRATNKKDRITGLRN